jgi:hypothetical protein
MPAIGITNTELTTTGDTKDGLITLVGVYNTNLSGFSGVSENDVVYVASGGGLTITKPTGLNLIQNVGIVLKTNGPGTIIQGLQVTCIGRTNDVPTPLYIDHANQRVGIGTSSPSSTLNINGGTGSLSTGLTFGDGDTGIWESVDDVLRFSTASTTRVLINSSGNVGIGDSTPTRKLTVNGDIGVANSGKLFLWDSHDANYLQYYRWELNTSLTAYINNAGSGGLALKTAGNTRLHIDNSGNVGIGTTSPTEKLEVAGNISIGDSNEVRFGADSDLRIYHNGTNSNIENFTGTLQIVQTVDNEDITFRCDDGLGGTTPYLTIDGSARQTRFYKDTRHTDGIKASFGNSDDLQIYHDGSNSYIKDGGTGSLYTLTNAYRLTNAAGNENMIWAEENSFVKLYHNNSAKLETTSTGVEVTGNINVSGSVQRQISTTHHCININSSTGAGQDFWIPFIEKNEQPSPNVTHKTVAPYNGVLKKVIVHSTGAFATNTQIRFHRINNGATKVFANDNSTDDVTTNVTADMSTAYSSVAFNFTSGNTFSAGDQLGLGIVRNNTGVGDVAITAVWEYELF